VRSRSQIMGRVKWDIASEPELLGEYWSLKRFTTLEGEIATIEDDHQARSQ